MRAGWTTSAVHAGLRVIAALDAQQGPSARRYTAESSAVADIVSQVEDGVLDPVRAAEQFDELTQRIRPSPPT